MPVHVDWGEVHAGDRGVDGVQASEVVVAESFDHVAAVLREAGASKRMIVPWGGGTLMGLGNVPTQIDIALDLSRLDQVVIYEPDDLTISVQAGCRIGALDRLLEANGQMLPCDVARPDEATIGGLYASAISGPRRFGHGSLRDLVIGIASVSPSGEVARGGGMVVKNVSGYDMMRLHYGALGSLGVVLQLNFKVLPAPRSTQTVVATFAELGDAFEAAMAVRESPLAPTAMALLDDRRASEAGLSSKPWTLLLRADGPEQSVPRQAERLAAALGSAANQVSTLDREKSLTAWSAVNQALSAEPAEDRLNIRVGTAPSHVREAIDGLRRLAEERPVPISLTSDLGSGLIYAAVDGSEVAVESLTAFWERAREIGRHAIMLSAPVAVKAGTDVFGKSPAGFAVMRALKRQFDPSGILNRGRFVGHL